jgi:hypothetical protein
LLLIVLGVLFLLDNLNIMSGIDWGTIWKLWPILLIAIGLEIILGRRVSCGGMLVIVIVVVIGTGAVLWTVAGGDGERTVESFAWPMEGVERAEVELDLGVGKLELGSESDMGDLLVADLDLAPGDEVSQRVSVGGDVARGRIVSDRPFFSLPGIFGRKGSEWDLKLNSRVRWEIEVNSGVGETRLDLSDLRVSDFRLDSGVGSVDVTMPRRGTVRAVVDGGVGDIRIDIPEGVQARVRVDRGIGDLKIGNRFERHGDYYETESFGGAESFIDLEIDIGVGSVTVR